MVNFPVLGKKYGGLMKKIVGAINNLSQLDVDVYEKSGKISLTIGGDVLTFSGDDLVIKIKNMPGYLTARSEGVLVTLNTHVSKELEAEGYVREFVNKAQNIRKELGLVVTDRVVLSVFGDEGALNMIEAHKKYVSEELLVESVLYTNSPAKNSFLFEFNNFKMYIGIELHV